MNAIFVADKPTGLSSNQFLSRLKRKYKVKKAGYSGTLDPFASGALIVAFGSYTRLFRFLNKSPKVYEATMWIGASSKSLDNQNITQVQKILPFAPSSLEIVRQDLLGEVEFIPPKYSAKNINGERAYNLAKKGIEFELKKQTMQVFSCEILHYMHPFLTFRISLSEGGYVRSYAELFAKKLGFDATLTALRRISEGKFKFENEKFLNPTEILDIKGNEYLGDISDLLDGKELNVGKLKFKENGIYLLNYDKFFSIIEVQNDMVNYCLNKVEKC
ncbi:tRNA pseudouridine(55) synthase TruB [Campylobacter sp. RM9344]|uniref:tRNA pseudouridine synthase B n=1 Tax=Campylobacter californiensis TaxID=1032243 RepID=A0AAW3ZRS9_9BACT|nr:MULTISPECIES: tRNA pseudouridine(55) synthase TruB [unclassified Campylobacter]MBE2983950.1 tRNA pseudouridine(55) synthase TruB [Campylobacter sp. RM6883]MBE2986112.1 tRNA pseudouridine(55) synthase TruB [Campylobacter sp. RM12919]MBE2987525.1 tRNA pseudouridine(55) synthase TruB [Campylobacter sp. RM12920]MBE2994488.1 tRNA pseudouridine(55) synthase TruB [Campylobacter sp. RM6913]MBE3028796.1 tRNA pseudouridine(55) synthase TruB [Campylobacter sp. RM9344]